MNKKATQKSYLCTSTTTNHKITIKKILQFADLLVETLMEHSNVDAKSKESVIFLTKQLYVK